MAKHKGKILNEHYGRGAKQARYRENGVWYHLLTEFPADLYDANGVIGFDTKAHYQKYIPVGPDAQSTHADVMGRGISHIPGYEELTPSPSSLL
ncbi:MAG TPA: hypothetical protein VKG65_06150 [Terriglobales bacterium]|nr:hypothetical protein [Terriglobales bacterium]